MGRKSKWTFDAIHEIASCFQSRSEFQAGNAAAYLAARRQGILDEVCVHMPKPKKGCWSFDVVQAEAKKYNTRESFHKNSIGAYASARRNGWLDTVCAHMPKRASRKDSGLYHTHAKPMSTEKALNIAKGYALLKEFRAKEPQAYRALISRNLLDSATKHMVRERRRPAIRGK